MLMNTSKYTWVYLYTHGKPEDVPAMAEPISTAYMDWPHSLFTLSTASLSQLPPRLTVEYKHISNVCVVRSSFLCVPQTPNDRELQKRTKEKEKNMHWTFEEQYEVKKKNVNQDSHIASSPISKRSFFKGVRCLILASSQRKIRIFIIWCHDKKNLKNQSRLKFKGLQRFL